MDRIDFLNVRALSNTSRDDDVTEKPLIEKIDFLNVRGLSNTSSVTSREDGASETSIIDKIDFLNVIPRGSAQGRSPPADVRASAQADLKGKAQADVDDGSRDLFNVRASGLVDTADDTSQNSYTDSAGIDTVADSKVMNTYMNSKTSGTSSDVSRINSTNLGAMERNKQQTKQQIQDFIDIIDFLGVLSRNSASSPKNTTLTSMSRKRSTAPADSDKLSLQAADADQRKVSKAKARRRKAVDGSRGSDPGRAMGGERLEEYFQQLLRVTQFLGEKNMSPRRFLPDDAGLVTVDMNCSLARDIEASVREQKPPDVARKRSTQSTAKPVRSEGAGGSALGGELLLSSLSRLKPFGFEPTRKASKKLSLPAGLMDVRQAGELIAALRPLCAEPDRIGTTDAVIALNQLKRLRPGSFSREWQEWGAQMDTFAEVVKSGSYLFFECNVFFWWKGTARTMDTRLEFLDCVE
jgi:hypothetical protein